MLQADKSKTLLEHETQKIAELDDKYNQELKEWKGNLRPRKQVRSGKSRMLPLQAECFIVVFV